LNKEQREAVDFCLSQPNISLIHGPPGTGKTSTVCEIIYEAVTVRGLRVLATAGSNIAVDNIVERLAARGVNVVRIGHPARMLKSVYESCLDS
jgi:superfamily I DNA and/or RNA helicase